MHIQIRISGPRGCGKTFTLNRFAEFVREHYPNAVINPIVQYEDVTGIPNEFLAIVVRSDDYVQVKEKFDVT